MEVNLGKIVIVGGGFAGLNLAKKLAGYRDYEVVLVDKNNYHFFRLYFTRFPQRLLKLRTSATPFEECSSLSQSLVFLWER